MLKISGSASQTGTGIKRENGSGLLVCIDEPRHEKTFLCGFRRSPTQTGLSTTTEDGLRWF